MLVRSARRAIIVALFPYILAVAAPSDAQKELYAARYTHAAELARKSLEADPTQADQYYVLVRALLGAHHASEAYEAADQALKHVPETAAAQTAAGLAEYRRGDLLKSENYYLAALKLDRNYPGALIGMASIYSAVSRPQAVRQAMQEAYKISPEDPQLMLAHANTLKGEERLAVLQTVLGIYDPDSREARGLRARISSDKALAGRSLRRLKSPYEPAQVKLVQLFNGPRRLRGFGLHVRFNQRQTLILMLDTGASGISVTPKAAEKAGLELLTNETTEMNGIGDDRSQDSLHYIASEIAVGNVVISEVPVSAFKAAKDEDIDGLIGADVFQRFLITLDFPRLELSLDPRPKAEASEAVNERDASVPAQGFYKAMRFGNHLTIPTSINQQPARLFLIDSGSSRNLIDTAAAREATKVNETSMMGVRGLQGAVKGVSLADRITLIFAGFRQENPDMLAISLEKTNDLIGVGLAGVLGMPVLEQMKLTIDYRNGTVRFEHKK